MSDIHNILNKFNQLGIKNQGLTVDAPVAPAKEQSTGSGTDVNANAHARNVNESVRGKHIPGVSDIASNDMAALAGINKPQQRPKPANPNPNSMHIVSNQSTDKWSEVDTRLSNIESKLNTIFESIQKLNEISDEDYREKRKALQDLQADPNTAKDPELQAEIKRRKARLEKEREETTAESLERGFASFLKELESN